MTFSYEEFITRNIGFVSKEEQEKLRNTKVFIPGVGGMGGAALGTLVRMGVENFIIADMDVFDVSNMNRQMFANMDTVGKPKVESTVKGILAVNPNIKVETYGQEWIDHLDEILPKVDIAINGNDDVRAALILMRKAKQHGKTVIDAFASPLPNVFVVSPNDPRPEEAFGFPTVGLKIEDVTEEMLGECSGKEIEHVMVNSSSANHIDMDVAAEMIRGERSRMSFAPMVWTTGCMMAYEVARFSLGKKPAVGVKGTFFNPWTMKVEKPKNFLVARFRRMFVRKFMNSLGGEAKTYN